MYFILVLFKFLFYFIVIIFLMYFLLFFSLDSNLMLKFNEFFYNSNLNLTFFFDFYTFMFLLTILLVVMNVFEFMNFYMMKSKNMLIFMFFVMIFIFSMLFLVCSMNLLTMIFGWEGLGFSSFYLIFFYNNYESWKSSIKTMINNKIGDAFIMISLIYMILFSMSTYMNFFFFFCLMTKSAQYPFMAWLPMAMSAPTPISAMVHSSTLVTAGLYILYRYMNFFITFLNLNFFMNVSLISMFVSGLKSLMEKDMKKVIALSTLSQISMIMFMNLTNFKNLSFIYMCNHAFFKSLLFINLGFSMMNNFMNQNFFNSKISILNSLFNISFKVSVLNLMNLSFFSSFFIKEIFLSLIMESCYSILNMLLFYFSTFFTMIYSLKLLMFSFTLNFNLLSTMNIYMKNPMILFFFTNLISMFFSKMILYMNFYYMNGNLILLLIYIFMLITSIYVKNLNFKITFFLMYLNFLVYSFPLKKMIKSFNLMNLWMETFSFYTIMYINVKKSKIMDLKTIFLIFMLMLFIFY